MIDTTDHTNYAVVQGTTFSCNAELEDKNENEDIDVDVPSQRLSTALGVII